LIKINQHCKNKWFNVQPIKLHACGAAQIKNTIHIKQEKTIQANKVKSVLRKESTVGGAKQHKKELNIGK